ncbi:glycosyltransferase [Brumimicrobium mesophilum]|uniref:glycosyltransferase n=1 Tax=Brumimicrobium mesophilum TaxID=392717 RepID=UPI00131C69B4|nr:glycosyltransferase [Brumimicrobium mesophilum]
MKNILATAYAINPYKGSEDGMGWNFVMQIARFNNVIAITRENNKEHIEKYMSENPNELYENIQFLYFDLPYWMRFWKKGGRGAMLYYIMWQRGIVQFIKKQNLNFDIAHNLNFHNDWTPSFLWKLKKPMVWGPVGHHPSIPKQYLAPYANKYLYVDRLTWWVKKYFWNISLSLKSTVKHTNHMLCMNHSVPEVLSPKGNYSVAPSVATQDFGWNDAEDLDEKFTLISAGRLVPLKGFDLTIEAYAKFFHQLKESQQQKCQLLIVGSGPEEQFLKDLASKLNVLNHIKFINWIKRDELMKLYKKSSAFLFPSHEGAGMVVAEALSFGLPVICLDNEGPGQFINKDCGFAISHQDYKNTVTQLSSSIKTLHQHPEKRIEMSISARQRFEMMFHWDRRGEQLQKIYGEL